jgi:chorismate mutase
MPNLEEYRKQIDQIDAEIIKCIEQRLLVVEQIAKIKAIENLPVKNDSREQEILNKWISQSKNATPEFIKKLLNLILTESKNFQELLTKSK